MQNAIAQYGIDAIWHFTDHANTAKIWENGGLYSFRELQKRNMNIPLPGGNEWSHQEDQHRDLDQFVHLCFLAEHPMLYIARNDGRIRNPIWLKFNIAVLQLPGVMYTAEVANKRGVPLLNAQQAEQQIDFEVLFRYTDWRDPAVQERRRAATKAEILVPNFVPLNFLLAWHHG